MCLMACVTIIAQPTWLSGSKKCLASSGRRIGRSHNSNWHPYHGGPGYVSIPMSWWFSRGWEEYFTVVRNQRLSRGLPE
jgi:hypothetical protein